MSNQKKLFKDLKKQSETQGEQGVEEDRKKHSSKAWSNSQEWTSKIINKNC